MTITIDMKLPLEDEPLFLRFPHMDSEEFYAFCQTNPDLPLELTAKGEIEVTPPAGSETGIANLRTGRYLDEWAEENGGYAFDSSAGFTLPSGAVRAPDAAWVRADRWESLTDTERAKFAPLCPDFVIEIMSPSDSLTATQAKMEEYLADGALLGWLIDRKRRVVFVYRPGQAPYELIDPTDVSGDPELPGFVLSLRRIF